MLSSIFKYLDQHWTKTKERTTATTKQPTSKLVPGQDLNTAADIIFQNPGWTPSYQALTVKSPSARSYSLQPPVQRQTREEPTELYRTYSVVDELTRTVSDSTQGNLDELKEWLAARAQQWADEKPSAEAVSEGHALVFKVCSESTAPRDAEFQCFDMFLDYCRGACEQFSGEERARALKSLERVFRYLNQHYTATKPRQGAKTTKQATSKLAAGQKLSLCAEQIERDVNWLPLFYTTSVAPDGTPMEEPVDSRRQSQRPRGAPAQPAARSRSPLTDNRYPGQSIVTPAMRYKMSGSERQNQATQMARAREAACAQDARIGASNARFAPQRY